MSLGRGAGRVFRDMNSNKYVTGGTQQDRQVYITVTPPLVQVAQTRSGAHQASYRGLFSGGTARGRAVDHSLSSSAAVKNA
jgi:hypothetical protein